MNSCLFKFIHLTNMDAYEGIFVAIFNVRNLQVAFCTIKNINQAEKYVEKVVKMTGAWSCMLNYVLLNNHNIGVQI